MVNSSVSILGDGDTPTGRRCATVPVRRRHTPMAGDVAIYQNYLAGDTPLAMGSPTGAAMLLLYQNYLARDIIAEEGVLQSAGAFKIQRSVCYWRTSIAFYFLLSLNCP